MCISPTCTAISLLIHLDIAQALRTLPSLAGSGIQSHPYRRELPNRYVLETCRGFAPLTDCSKTQELSCSGVSTDLVNHSSEHPRFRVVFRFTGLSTGANYCAKPYKKREVWESNPRLPHYQPEVSFKLILLQPRYRRVWTPALPPYCRSCDLTLP